MSRDHARDLQAPFARMVWDRMPSVRLEYDSDDDVVVAVFVQADAAHEVVIGDRLLVELDGEGALAGPVALYLTDARLPGEAVRVARELLGERAWDAVRSLRAARSGPVEVSWSAEEAQQRRVAWARWWRRTGDAVTTPGWEEEPPPLRAIGVEFVPGRVHAVLTDGDVTVLDQETRELQANDVGAVVAAVTAAAAALADRRPEAQRCPIGIQLGGPVTVDGVVRHYDKPRHPDDEPWKDEPLGHLVRAATGRDVHVFNDATALAAWESRIGLGRSLRRFAVIVVRRGVGAKLVRNGRVEEEFPMEIGVFAPVPKAALDEPGPGRRTIQAASNGQAIVERVSAVRREPCATIEDAATIAQTDAAVAEVFHQAGAGLARAVAAIQAIVDPEGWAIYGLPALVDEDGVAGRRFVAGLRRSIADHLDYHDFTPAVVVSRPMFGDVGARSAAAAAFDRGGGARHATPPR